MVHFMVYRQTEKIRVRKEQTRQRLLKAAREAIAEGGFAAVQMSSIAAAAGVATGTLYRYFPSKADVLTDVFRLVSQREVDVMAQVAAADGTAAERLEAAVETFARRALKAPRLAYAMIFEPVDPEVDAERLVFRRSYADVFQMIVEAGVSSGEFPEQDVSVVANCLVGTCAESLVGPLAPGQVDEAGQSETSVRAIARFCLNAVSK